jgi:hypothetical protein
MLGRTTLDFSRPGFEFAKDSRGYPIIAGMPGRPDESGVLARGAVIAVDLLLLYSGLAEFALIGEATTLGSAFLTSTGVAAGIIKTEADLIAWNDAANEAIKQVANGLSPAGGLAEILGASIFGRDHAAVFGEVGAGLQSTASSLLSSESGMVQRTLELKELSDAIEKLKERLRKDQDAQKSSAAGQPSAGSGRTGPDRSGIIPRPGGPAGGDDDPDGDPNAAPENGDET